jgi:hypothetical protein
LQTIGCNSTRNCCGCFGFVTGKIIEIDSKKGELNQIFAFAGLFAFFLELIFPCVLVLVSAKYCVDAWGKDSERNPYTLMFSKPIYAYITLAFGGAALLFALLNFAAPGLFEKH